MSGLIGLAYVSTLSLLFVGARAAGMRRTAETLPDAQTVTEVEHYTDRLFRFRTTRPQSLRFRSGEFGMIWS